MYTKVYKKVIKGRELKHFLDIPDSFLDWDLEITVKPIKKRTFNSLSKIKIDTKAFNFNREEANER